MSNRQTKLMTQARSRATFDPYSLTSIIYENEETVQKRRAAFQRIETVAGTIDTLKLPPQYANMNREEMYEYGLAQAKIALEDGLDYQHDFFTASTARHFIANASPFGLMILFNSTIKLLASPEQQKFWLPKSESGQIIGSYSATELGHGSNVQGIETTATFDPTKDEFEIHTPSLTATKFWPGGIGFSSTHTIVVARLITENVDYGPHQFVVQLRSTEDFQPIPGIQLGDLGLKMSYNETDNGFATFDHVRIPRSHLLMGFASVSRCGEYKKVIQNQEKGAGYATLMYIRLIIANKVSIQLAQAVTISTRYSVVREQGRGPNGGCDEEVAIITYKSQHYRLFMRLAQAYAMLFASKSGLSRYQKLREQQQTGNHQSLAFTHMIAAGLKAWSTSIASAGAEDVRKCCGGHGLLMTSGLPDIAGSVVASATFEGENYVLWQQVGRRLMKHAKISESNVSGFEDLNYVKRFWNKDSNKCGASGNQFMEPNVQLSIFQHRASRLVMETSNAIRLSEEQGHTPSEAWNEHMMAIIDASRAHMDVVVLESFIDFISSLPTSTSHPLVMALHRLRALFSLTTITSPDSLNAISFVEDGHLSMLQLREIRACVNILLEELLPDAIALTDAWDFTDGSLGSALGMRDGNVYETLMNWTQQIPINKRGQQGGVLKPEWERYIKPFIHAKL